MELTERETLVRVEQQLKDSVQNQSQIMVDLKEIFSRIESDSKMMVAVTGDVKSHLDNSKYRWDELEKKLTHINEKIKQCEEKTGDNTKDIASIKDIVNRLADCEECIEENRKSIAEEKEARSLFQQDIVSTIKTVGWIFGSLATLAAIISGIVLVLQLFGKLKGV
jgi:predicted  nucleic acid-binding Zn-ribbon protein